MKCPRFTLLSVAVLMFAFSNAYGAKNSDLGKSLGSPSFVDDLDRKELGENWSVAKGDWTIANASMVGKELETDDHAAVLSLRHPNHNSAIQFSFQLDGPKSFNLSFNKSGGHLFRISVNQSQVMVSLDKDKKKPGSKPMQLGSGKAEFKSGKWYTMLVTVNGADVSVKTDNGIDVRASHADINQKKPNYRFVMKGESLLLDDVKVWDR